MKLQFLTVAAVALMAAPMLHAQTTATPTRAPKAARQHMGNQIRPRGDMMKELDLTADQQARMKAIHSKYASQMKAARASSKPDMDAMKAARTRGDTAAMRVAREKMRADMAPNMKLRQQEMAEVRGVLTPDQQKKFDARRSTMKAGKRGGGKHGWNGKQPAKPAATGRPSATFS
ncbi:MAG: Spy/CpxP family protein refolding chaperone [Gemmatimonadaceae bacterium]